MPYITGRSNFEMDETRFNNIDSIIKSNPKILSSPEMSKVNRAISYMTFFFKEIHEYFSLKTADGVYFFIIRNKLNELNRLKQEIKRLEMLGK